MERVFCTSLNHAAQGARAAAAVAVAVVAAAGTQEGQQAGCKKQKQTNSGQCNIILNKTETYYIMCNIT